MKKNKNKAFTLLELMVSIFITITIIASFYKLYNASAKTERSTSIRVSVNLMGEQILDTIADSFRLIGLNGVTGDLSSDDLGILRGTLSGGWGKDHISFTYISPYGSPITKLADKASGTYPACTFKLFNSAAFHSAINRLYVHNQDGVFVFTVGSPTYDGNAVVVTASAALRSAVTTSDGTSCADLFPASSLVTGSDFVFNLNYTYPKNLVLSYDSMDVSGNTVGNSVDLINSEYNSSTTNNQSSQIPYFVLEFMRQYKNGDSEVRTWVKNVSTVAEKKEVVAVRFGFVMLSLKDRNTVEDSSAAPTMSNEYCIFDEKLSDKQGSCYQLTNPNYTASVFRRVVYLANYRLLSDQVK